MNNINIETTTHREQQLLKYSKIYIASAISIVDGDVAAAVAVVVVAAAAAVVAAAVAAAAGKRQRRLFLRYNTSNNNIYVDYNDD